MSFKNNLNRYFFLYSLVLLAGFACSTKTTDKLYTANDFAFVGNFTEGLEGPAVDNEGNLYFVNPYHNGAVGKVDVNGNFEMFIETLPNGSVANGIRFGKQGLMYLADYVGHKILTVDLSSKLVKTYLEETEMNQPNDLAIGAKDVLFASDPKWADSTGQLWAIHPGGEAVLLADDMGTTNGIEISPDEKTLYVNESVQRKVWAFDLSPTGTISNKQLLIQFDDFGLDGMRCDVNGNLYMARYGKGVVAKVSPKGELLKEIKLKGNKPTNVAFGGKDGRKIFVTMQDRGYIEYFTVESPGKSFHPQ